MFRIGFGKDIHRLISGRPLYIGGIDIPSEKGEDAHSDGDVLLHAIVEALLGALNLGDIGEHFSNKDPQYKNIRSSYFVDQVLKLMNEAKYEIVNIDTEVTLESPKLSKYKAEIQENVVKMLNIKADQFNFKAGTNEKCDEIGHGDAIDAYAVVLLNKKD